MFTGLVQSELSIESREDAGFRAERIFWKVDRSDTVIHISCSEHIRQHALDSD
jgi:hypothetical protein